MGQSTTNVQLRVGAWRAENTSSAAPEINNTTIDKMAKRELPLSMAVVPMSSGPKTAANLPIML